MGDYDINHTEEECDKCLKNVGKNNLYKVPFLFLNKGDTKHKDIKYGYRQYYVCKKCLRHV